MKGFTVRLFIGFVLISFLVSSIGAEYSYAQDANSIPHGSYLAEYYNNPTLLEPFEYQQIEHDIKYLWEYGSPDKLNIDKFSIRWRGYFDFESCVYLFHFRSDDGIRVWIDDELIIDHWYRHGAIDLYSLVRFEQGEHLVTCEYYEHDGFAEILLDWSKYSSIKKVSDEADVVVLPLLVEFSDVRHTNTLANIEKHFFSSIDTDYSLRNFYFETSEGKIDIQKGEYGVGQWVTLPSKKGEYSGVWSSSKSSNIGVLLRDVVNTLKEENLDLSEYDANNDKILDYVVIMCAGVPDSDSIFWYHNGYSQDDVTINGYKIHNYCMVREILNNNDYESLRILCHEFFHSLGGEDLYSYISSYDPIGPWDIMGKEYWNFGLSGFSRYYLGWLEPTRIESNGRYTVNALGSRKENQLFRIDIPQTKEYFLIENRQRISTDNWWHGIVDEGIVIYHVDDSIPQGFRFNDGYPEYRNSAIHTQNPTLYTTYCLDNLRVRFTPFTSPNSKDYKDFSPFEIYITDISESGMEMSFSVEFRKNRAFPIFQPASLNLGQVELNEVVIEEIQITNIGTGVLFCEVDTSDYWFFVDKTEFLDNDIVIRVRFDLSKTTIGKKKEYIYLKNRDGRVYKMLIKLDVVNLIGDLNYDGGVDDDDYILFKDAFGSLQGEEQYRSDADFNGDKVINIEDLFVISKKMSKKG